MTDKERKTREPEPGTEAARIMEGARRRGLNARYEEPDPSEHRIIFFGAVPEEEPEEDGE
jgi:hypothetical protein